MRLYIGLVHFPVYNRLGQSIASAVTTFDLHDIARAARTYGVRRFFVITPLEDQRALAERVVWHWTEGYGARYNADRSEAMRRVCVVPTLERAVDMVAEMEREAPLLLATDASRENERCIPYEEARGLVRGDRAAMVLFGTAWGLDRSVLDASDHLLAPIVGATEYNHLSVRSAAAIILDRLAGPGG